jgi:hypothetical protein
MAALSRLGPGCAAAAVVCVGLAGCGTASSGVSTLRSLSSAGSSVSGTIRVFSTVGYNGKGPVTVTGVIGDFGTSVPANRNGKEDSNGDFEKVTLRRGSFLLDERALNNGPVHFKSNKSNCSTSVQGTAKIAVSLGTGTYAGIRGTVKGTFSFADVEPRVTSGAGKGDCSGKNVTGARHFSVLIASGVVTY